MAKREISIHLLTLCRYSRHLSDWTKICEMRGVDQRRSWFLVGYADRCVVSCGGVTLQESVKFTSTGVGVDWQLWVAGSNSKINGEFGLRVLCLWCVCAGCAGCAGALTWGPSSNNDEQNFTYIIWFMRWYHHRIVIKTISRVLIRHMCPFDLCDKWVRTSFKN